LGDIVCKSFLFTSVLCVSSSPLFLQYTHTLLNILSVLVVPGLLLSFAARLDAAKSLLGLLGGGNGALNSYGCPEQKHCSFLKCCSRGYFFPVCISYAVGLMMANMAVYLMNMGQPALLYLVPCCVGTMSFMAWRRGELRSLYEGPKAIRTADAMLYGEYHEQPAPSNHHAPLPLEDGQNPPDAPCAEDGGGMSLSSRNIV
jgi:signal peptide peptidase-like protein 2B